MTQIAALTRRIPRSLWPRTPCGVVTLLALAACGAPAAAPPAAPPSAPLPAATRPAPVAADAQAVPRQIDALVDLVPGDATLVAHLPRPDALLAGIDPAAREVLFTELVARAASGSGIEPELARGLTEAFDGGVMFVAAEGTDPVDPFRRACMAARFRDAAPAERWLTTPSVRKTQGERFVLQGGEDGALAYGAWLAEARVALLCADPKLLTATLRVADRREPSFRASPLFKAERAGDPWVAVDLYRFLGRDGGRPETGSRLFAALPLGSGAPGLEVELALYGRHYPPLGAVLAASDHAAVASLPRGAVGALGLSLKRANGKKVRDFLDALGQFDDAPFAAMAAGELEEIGLEFDDLERALGGELAIGVYRDAKHKVSLDARGDEILKHGAILFALSTADDAALKKFFGAVAAAAKKSPRGFKVTAASITREFGAGDLLRVEPRRGFLLLGRGDPKVVADLFARFGKEKESLGASPRFAEARPRARAAGHLLSYFDVLALKDQLDPASAAQLGASQAPLFLSLLLGPSERGLEVSLGSSGGAELLGMGAALAVHSVRRYIASAKSAEARNTLGAISRGAVAAYERELPPSATQKQGGPPVHQLCKSAVPVPAAVPKGVKYKPSSSPGQDFEQGDDLTGWRCLRFAMEQPMYYRYDYRAGGGYKGPSRGGPDPGPDGFEVSAEGDLDGDGKTSLFTRIGRVVNGQIVLSPNVFIADEFE